VASRGTRNLGRIRSDALVEELPTSSPSANPVGGIGGHLTTAAGKPARKLLPLTLTAIGVVYGDIVTSPLYAMRECFFGSHAVPPTHANVLGILSLIIYSLLVIISVKYIAIVMRADNQGEGGILALTALLPSGAGNGPRWPALVLMGIFGAALLSGDGMITPAITVLGAVEGLKVATPLFEPYVVPIAVVILIAVFAIQRHGTHRVGGLFGPIMVGWFVVLAVLGASWLVAQPEVLTAVDPRCGLWSRKGDRPRSRYSRA
jgi:KUP system potassium uptake protein